MWPVAIMILTLAIMIFLLMFVKKSAETSETSSRETACQSSVFAHAQFGTDINCPAERITIKTKYHEEAKRQIADEMVRCWDNYGKGQIKIFSKEGTKFCAVCSVIEFKRKDEKIEGFPLFTTTKFFSRGGQRFTYAEYFSREAPTKALVDYYVQIANQQPFDTNEKYAVLFTFYNKRTMSGMVWESLKSPSSLLLFSGGMFGPLGPLVGAGIVFYKIDELAKDGKADLERVQAVVAKYAPSDTDWIASVMITLLKPENLKTVGCEELPVALLGIEQESETHVVPEAEQR